MVIENLQTQKQYTMPRTSWDKLGKRQKLFKVINPKDEEEIKPQLINNKLKPDTGDKKDTTHNNTKQTSTIPKKEKDDKK